MRELKSIQEADGLAASADKFDDMYLRLEALANHAHDVIKYAGEEKLVGEWWETMQAALQKMQGISDEIRQPRLPGMEEAAQEEISNEQSTANVQEENQMQNIDDMIANLSKLAGLNVVEAKDKKPDFLDVDKDGNKKEDMEDAVDDKEEAKESVELDEKAQSPYAIGMAQAMKSTGDEPPLKKSTIKKAHEIADAVKKNESVELDECGMPMTMSYNDGMDAYPGQSNGPAEPQGDMYQLNVQTPTKTMTFVTDNPEEIIQVLQASGVKIQSTEMAGYQPPTQQPKTEVNSVPSSPAPVEAKEEKMGEASKPDFLDMDKDGDKKETMKSAADDAEDEDKEVKEGIAALRKLSGYHMVDEGKFGNSVAGAKGDPRIVGDTIDFALAGTGNAKSGRGDKGLSTMGDNPLGRNDRDLTESKMQSEFESWLKTQESK